MTNELAEVQTPKLEPPNINNSSATPESISSSIENYSPVIPEVAKVEKFKASNNSQTFIGTKEDDEYVGSSEYEDDFEPLDRSAIDNLVEDVGADTLINSNSNTSIKTFSSNEGDDYTAIGIKKTRKSKYDDDDDDDLFEHFNGSTKDLASPAHKRAVELGYNRNDGSSSPLQVDKRRNNANKENENIAPVKESDDFKHNLKYRNLSRNFTPVSTQQTLSDRVLEKRILDVEKEVKELDTKYYKLEREIEYVDKMLKELNYNKFEIEEKQPVEIRKLLYARGKLVERLQDAKKKRYDVGVTLIKLRRNLYGDKSGDMTEYFARNVSY